MMKYIITNNGPILFPANIPNETFSGEIKSHGYCVFFFSSELKRFQCFVLPEITSTPQDSEIIETFLNA